MKALTRTLLLQPERRHPIKKKTQPNTSLTFSISSEDPDGLRVAHDARPDTHPTDAGFDGSRHGAGRERARWTQSTIGGASSYYPYSNHSLSDQLTTTESESSEPGTPTTLTSHGIGLNALPEEDHGTDDLDLIYPHHHPNALDPNDVSFRLKLLVENNYYLPPAHSKPLSISPVGAHSPGPASPTKPQHSTGGSFRGLFRLPLGISRSRSPSQPHISPLPSPRPTLGVRKAVSTEGLGLGLSQSARNKTGLLRPSSPRRAVSADMALDNEPKGRVVVIRERLDEPEDAVEQIDGLAGPSSSRLGLPSPSVPSKKPSPSSVPQSSLLHSNGVGLPPAQNSMLASKPVIDPTDSVDLPSYKFEPQASANIVHGLGPGQALNTSAILDFIPASPGGPHRAMSPEDEAWRRALLFEAVDLSISQSSGGIPDLDGGNRTGATQQQQPRTVASMPSYSTFNSPSHSTSSLGPPVGAEPPKPRIASRDRAKTITQQSQAYS
jgi:hypothetical protein